MRLGAYLYGLAAIATGVIDIVWGGFERAHQPIQAFGDDIPGRQIFAYAVAAVLLTGGAAVLRSRSTRFGAVALGVVYAIFAVFWLPRLYTAPHALGLHASVVIGVLSGVCQQLVVVAAAALLYAGSSTDDAAIAPKVTVAARWIFGIGCIDFGLTHLTGIAAAAAMVPSWMPLGQDFWVVLTGGAFILAGIAFLTSVVDVAAARLLALMLLVFSGFALAPNLFVYPHNQITWGANAYNLIAVASAWIFASWLAACRQPAEQPLAAQSFA